MWIQQPIGWMCLVSDTDIGYQITRFLQGLAIEFGVVCCATMLAAKARWLKYLLYFLVWLLMAITLFLVLNFSQNISQETLTVLVETTPKESGEFIDTYAFTTESLISYAIDLAVAVLIVVASFFEHKKRLKKPQAKAKKRPILGAVALACIAMVAVCYGWLACCNNSQSLEEWRECYPNDSLDPFSQSLHALNSLRAFSNDIDYAVATAKAEQATTATVEADSALTVVYVLGESYNKHHAHLYGYHLPTTPCLDRERASGNLFVFNDVVSQINYTSVVVKNSFSLNSVGDGEQWFQHPNFPTVFHHAGYDVWFWDMQRTYEKNEFFTVTLNSFLYNPEISRLSYTACNDSTPRLDHQIVDDFSQKVKFAGKHNLVIFHLMGQHVSYFKRYPVKFKKFNWRDEISDKKWLDKERKNVIAAYDNATYYNDTVMSKIFNTFANQRAVVVYVADHGEEIYDYRDVRGRYMTHDPTPNALRHQNEVPMMVWCSKPFQAAYPETVAQLKAAENRPMMTDVVGHLLLHLGRVRSPYYNPVHDVISPQYKPSKRVVYGHADYDKIMQDYRNSKKKQ